MRDLMAGAAFVFFLWFGFGMFLGSGQWTDEVFWFAVFYTIFIGPFALIPLAICHKFFRSSWIALFALALAFLLPVALLKFRVIMPSTGFLIISAISAAVLVHQGIFKLFDLDAASRESS
jgi:phosphate starvation-inducible membrane PsiE